MMRSPVRGYELQQLAGDAAYIDSRGSNLVELAVVMENTASGLESIASDDSNISEATANLKDLAEECAADIRPAAVRYRGTGQALCTYAEALSIAQLWITNNQESIELAEQNYESALQANQAAQNHLDSAQSSQEDDSQSGQQALEQAEDQAQAAQQSAANAETERNSAWQQFEVVFEEWSEAYDTAINGIEDAIEEAGNNDGFWEKLDIFLDVLGVVLFVLGIIAVIIGAPFTSILGILITVLSIISALGTILKAINGRATLGEVFFEIAGLALLGLGRLANVPKLGNVIRESRNIVTGFIRSTLSRPYFTRVPTWHRIVTTPARWVFAPIGAKLALPRPSVFVNPFKSIVYGGSEFVQAERFAETILNSKYVTNPRLGQIANDILSSLPNNTGRIRNTAIWSIGTGFDFVGAYPVIDNIFDHLVPSGVK